ncbi:MULTISPECIES: DUF2243 domain-containing protein [Rhizobiaceae]|jgi:uncharacterized membrane protein|uniref:DUF2243 domain-containing protein n=1 Tax=Agrobacterium tumefaciens TaxID=358 RepID=A0AAE6BSB6_AGRTU|nr:MULTISPECIES: DUF2243 domain-containing protein [Rhizobiaceae]KNY31834.1 membrane protein [Agrobacterium sp. SUL3]KRA61963.1 hypothetical protein ASD85_27045 [Rhizobium sp. Root651]MCA2372775.1 DUF2243 domain-containing protein [Agrobacterium tomkonis CIP 111-78]MQU73606.1 DUF2243 domain-containing protein [Sinorhizobium medicae]NSY51649.1 DUF2243 domain-containing protein [Agrobacterium tumefaciens]
MTAAIRPNESDKQGFPATLIWAGYALGFGLGGFFDGILLHQILQWHHLLSGVEEARQDIRVLILTDGLFHALMYVVAAAGLWLLWRSRHSFAARGADRLLFASALIGFGVWHILDSVLSHWILGIHRIRMDVENRMFWDLLWFVVFGLVPLALGAYLRRNGMRGDGRRISKGPVGLALAVLIAGPLAALPAPNEGPIMIVFGPGSTAARAMQGLEASGGRLLWSDASDMVWAVDMSAGGDVKLFYKHGAILISNSIFPAGCFNWTRV